ncbi:hypothetical protein GCM10020331_040930 [Ectobacillus funiculus]
MLAGAVLAGASLAQTEELMEFARNLGLAFQIRDDILDVEGNEEEIGKRVGSDVANEKEYVYHPFSLWKKQSKFYTKQQNVPKKRCPLLTAAG